MTDHLEKRLDVSGDICGITRTGPTGVEWICINPVHDKMYRRHKKRGAHSEGELTYSSNPKVEQHYMVNRWPNRKNRES